MYSPVVQPSKISDVISSLNMFGGSKNHRQEIQYKYDASDPQSSLQNMLWQYDSHPGHTDQILFTPERLVNNWDALENDQKTQVIMDFADPRKVESSKFIQFQKGIDAPQPLFDPKFTSLLFYGHEEV